MPPKSRGCRRLAIRPQTGERPVRILFRARRAIARSWRASRPYYRLRGSRLVGRPADEIWYFAYGANMHAATFRVRRGIEPKEWRRSRLAGYRLRFNLEGRPKGRAAPANLEADASGEVWGVAYRITRRDLLRLDASEGVPGRGYRHVTVTVEIEDGRAIEAVAYIAAGLAADGRPSLRYLNLLRDGARTHDLPADYIRFLDNLEPAAEPNREAPGSRLRPRSHQVLSVARK